MKAAMESTLTLEAVADHFEQWRKHKKKRERIPEPLWREAIGLLDTYQISQVTRTLRLSGSDLNKRRGTTRAGRRRKEGSNAKDTHAGTAFVEMDRQAIAQASELDATAWLELQRPDGLRLRIQSSGGAELLALVDRFIRV